MDKDKLRPVMYQLYAENPITRGWEPEGPERPGFFHCWLPDSEGASAIIENPDGTIVELGVERIWFTDREGGNADANMA